MVIIEEINSIIKRCLNAPLFYLGDIKALAEDEFSVTFTNDCEAVISSDRIDIINEIEKREDNFLNFLETLIEKYSQQGKG